MAAVAVDPLEAFAAELGPLRLPAQFCPHYPNVKQEWFLRRPELEVFFGGAAGPGKSWGLLMSAAQYVDVPGYNAVILRTTLQDHDRALIPIAHDWFGGTGAFWNGTLRRWTFPSGATLSFGYVKTIADLSHWKGLAYCYTGFDELTEFEEAPYLNMSRVLRSPPVLNKATGETVPLRKRAASNPGGPGHGWVKRRFIDRRTRDKDAVLIRATIHDNPHMNYQQYLLSLAHLLPVERARLIAGDWDVSEEGGKFHRASFGEPIALGSIDRPIKAVRYWDLAGTEPNPTNLDPDYTVGLLLVQDAAGFFTIVDVVRGRWNDTDVAKIVRQTAAKDAERFPHLAVYHFVEQDPGQAGKAQVNYYKREVLQGYVVLAGHTRINGVNAAKETRAAPAAAAVGNGLYRICPWEPTITKHDHSGLSDFLDEVVLFPNGTHDDSVDALSGAHQAVTTRVPAGRATTHRPRGRLPVATTTSSAASSAAPPQTTRPPVARRRRGGSY